MRRDLFPILFTIAGLIIAFGLWYGARNRGWFHSYNPDDLSLCRISNDTLCLRWKDSQYGISKVSTTRHNDDVMHISIDKSRGSHNNFIFGIDTINVNYLEVYGKVYTIKAIPLCE